DRNVTGVQTCALPIFQITGTDYNGISRTYYEALEIPEQFKEDGVYRKSFIMQIPAGIWTVREIPVSRYRMTGIKEVENGSIEGSTVRLDTKDHDTAKATFCNELVNYGDFSHNDLEINVFGKQVGR